LGGLIVQELIELGLNVEPLSSRTDLSQCDELSSLDALIIASPSVDAASHKLALQSGCHVIDVGIDANAIRSALKLDQQAKNRKRRIVLMAGLAPGFSGMMAAELAQQYRDADTVKVLLQQSSQGTAGKRGVTDMLDMLTDPSQPAPTPVGFLTDDRLGNRPRAFSLPTPEVAFLGTGKTGATIIYLTLFDAAWMNRAVEHLHWLRGKSERVYTLARDLLAAAKSKQPASQDEEVKLIAIAQGDDGKVLGREDHSFPSDYGATAKTACALARLALLDKPPFGAGHPLTFTDLESLKVLLNLDGCD
jgi:hypothetical protein